VFQVCRKFRPAALLLLGLSIADAGAASLADAARRMDADLAAGRPLVAHVVVALVDNQHQGIVPVPAALGDGTRPSANLYWGAMYGVRTWFRRSADWKALPISASTNARVLDRALFRREVVRDGRRAEVYLVAEAWKGENIRDALHYFLEMDRGLHRQAVSLPDKHIEAGGSAHVVVFIGHNGLMEFDPPALASSPARAPAHAGIVLACMSDSYFSALLREQGAPLLMTTGLMAPEAYTLDAALTRWFSGGDAAAVRTSAAQAYARHQKVSERAALRLFTTSATPNP
jgi:hypothetical protein